MYYLKQDFKLQQRKDYWYLTVMGVILAVHWSTFFKSIQVSTVAIGLLTFATFPIFVTFLEPYFFKEKIGLPDILIAFITFTGVIFVVPQFELGNNLTQGVLWGLISSLTYAILSMLNRQYVQDYPSSLIAFYEQFMAMIILIPLFFIYQPVFQPKDILLLALLGVVFTGVAHTLFIKGLKNIKTQVAGIISTLEPVYGILLAAVIIKEIPTARELLGGIIILCTALYATVRSK